MNKQCKACLKIKNISEYYRHKIMNDGFLNFCKACVRERVNRHRNNNIEEMRKKDRERGCRVNPEYTKKIRKLYPGRYKAHRMVAQAVKSGMIVKPKNCSICKKETRLCGHHSDYRRHLSVIWVCQVCHKAIHAKKIEI